MKRLNLLFILTSLNVLLVTIERFSITTKIVLQPHSFLRLHELVQMIILILATVIIPALFFKELSRNFEALLKPKGQLIGLLFIIGVYFYATGNGLHEVAGFFLNEYCNYKNPVGTMCQGLFINDFYTGNIFYFIGAMMMNFSLILLELDHPPAAGSRKEYIVLTINSLIYAFAIVAYASIDPVLVGLVFSLVTMVLVDFIIFLHRQKIPRIPFTLYCGIAYTVGSLIALVVRVFILQM